MGGQDFVSAHLWFNLASVSATGQSQESAVAGRDMTYGEMTPAQRAEGQRLAREWDEANPYQTASVSTTLYQAIADGLVEASFRGNGNSTGDAVTARVQKTAAAGSGSLVLSIPAGSMLRNDDPSVQDMVIQRVQGRSTGDGRYVQETMIVLDDDSEATYILSAYCANFDKENPSNSSSFTLMGSPDSFHQCIMDTGSDLSFSMNSVQAAVWMQSDALTYAEMSERFEITPGDWSSGQTIFRTCAQ